jgi:hypothetical protein
MHGRLLACDKTIEIMSKLKIERLGGLAGFGSKNSPLQSSGEINLDELSAEDKKAVEELFLSTGKTERSLSRDAFRYRISRMTSEGLESIEADEEKIPNAVKQCVKDEMR